MLQRLLFPTILLSLLTLTEQASAVASAELYRETGESFGRFEARVRFAAGDGIVASFFLWKDGSELEDVYWNELDFEKVGAGCELKTNAFHGLPEKTHSTEHPEQTGLCDGYHTYTYEWTPEYISWAVDGVEIRRDMGADAAAYADNAGDGLQMRLNVWPGNASFGGTFSEASLPAYQYVDWVEFSAYTPGAGDEGSNFSLTWREDFDAAPTGWATANWDSPYGLSIHNPNNVIYTGGVAVLALTADDATGYSGVPPQDGMPGDGAGGTADGVGGTGDGIGGTGGTAPPPSTGGAPATLYAPQDGCAYAFAPNSRNRWGLGAWAMIVLFGFLRRPGRASGGRCS